MRRALCLLIKITTLFLCLIGDRQLVVLVAVQAALVAVQAVLAYWAKQYQQVLG